MAAVMRGVPEGVIAIRRPIGPVLDQLDHVRPLERIAAGEDEERPAEAAHVVHHPPRFVGAQLLRVSVGHRFGAAVLAGEVAGAGRFPDDEEGSPVEIELSEGRSADAG
jgi:hypothetical protein